MTTKTFLRFALGAAAALPLAFGAGHAFDHHKQDMKKAEESKKGETIVDVASGNENFSTLVAAVKAAGLVETLKGEGPFTVFAPTNAAFEALPKGTVDLLLKEENKGALQTVLTYHVVQGEVKAGDLVQMIRKNKGTAEVKTVEGASLSASIKNGDVVLTDAAGNEIKVVNTNIQTSNGVIHAIDGVLLPTKPKES